MPLKEYDKVVGASPDIGTGKMGQRLRVSSSSERITSRDAKKAVVMAEMRDLEITSAKAEMERLRKENQNLRDIIQKLRSLDVNEGSDESDVESSNGILDNKVLDLATSLVSSSSVPSVDSNATVLKNPPLESDKTPLVEVPAQKGTTEGESEGHSQMNSETQNRLAQEILNRQIAENEQKLSSKTREVESMSVEDTEVSGNFSQPRLSYEVPDDFDPDSEDYNLSDVETTTSDEVLQAWGIGQHLSTVRETKSLSTKEGETYEDDDDDGSGWEAVGNDRGSASGTEQTSASEPISEVDTEHADSNKGTAADSASINSGEEDDKSTVLGAPRSASVHSSDDRTSTIAETGSLGSNDERWRTLMRDLTEDTPVSDLEKARSEAEDEERDARDKEYRDAIAEKRRVPAKTRKPENAGYISQSSPAISTNRHLDELKTMVSPAENTVEQDAHSHPSNEALQATQEILSANQASSNVILPSVAGSRTINPDDPWLIDKFNEIWSTLSPGLTAPTNSVGWINLKPVTVDGKGQHTKQMHGHLNANKPTAEEVGQNRISESERILLSFDPREDVIGILQPKVKGEKNILDENSTNIGPKKLKQAEVPQPKEKLVANKEPVRPIGKIENQFGLLKEEQSQRLATGREQHPDTSQENKLEESNSLLVEEISKVEQVPVAEKLPPPRSAPPMASEILIDLPSELKPSSDATQKSQPNWKPQPTLFSVKTGDLLNDPELMTQPIITSARLQKDKGRPDELRQKKSLRFHGVSPPSKVKTEIEVQDLHPALVTKSRQTVQGLSPKPLVSILKQDMPSTSATPKSMTKPYNYEYIREVCIRKLPKDITYSSLLDQVSGGLLEKVMIDWNTLEARITFAEPEAARRFYSKMERDGLWVHTELPHIRLVGRENLVQCTLGGFLWTQHSSQMSPSMIEGIWNRRASRCLLINNFPKRISMEILVNDIFRLFAGTSIKEKEIIETVGIKRNLLVSATGLMASVRFTAIVFAVRVGNELHGIGPQYAETAPIYDADPCGGLMGTEPPSVWMQGKVPENIKRETDRPAAPVSQPQVATAPPKPIVMKPVVAHRVSNPSTRGKNLEALGRQPLGLIRPVVGPIQSRAVDFTAMAKTFSEAAQATQNAVTSPIRQPASSIQPQPVQNQRPVTQEELPPQKVTFRYNYNNWDAEPKVEPPKPEGAHWNHKEQNLVLEYEQSLMKKRRRGSDADKTSTVSKKKAEKPKLEVSYYERLVYLTNLPRKLTAAHLLRFIRGGAVEHVLLQPPSSQYDTSKAIVIFIHRHSARDYKNYLQSPGLTIEPGHRIACMDNDPNDRRFDGIRLVPSHTIRSDGITRCLRIDMLPKGTTLDNVLSVIEEGMNHSALDFEHASISASPEDKDMVMVILRLISIGRVVWVAGMLRRNYEGIVLSYSRDPCQGPLSELEEVGVKEAY